MNRREYAEAKRRLDQIQRELETELLTPGQQHELELRAASLNRILRRGVVMSRAKNALIGAVFGAALAVLYNAFIVVSHTGYVPQTTAAWATFYAGLCAPWALIGALVGAILGRRGR